MRNFTHNSEGDVFKQLFEKGNNFYYFRLLCLLKKMNI